MPFGILKKFTDQSANKYNGKTDFLEAVSAGCALIAAADGDIEKSERNEATKLITKNKTLSAAFSSGQIKKALDHAFDLADSRSGKLSLKREIREVLDHHADWAEDIMVKCVEIAYADGEVEKAEEKVLNELSELLGVDYKQFLDETA